MATGTLTGQTIANTYKALLKITGTTAGGETLHATTQKVIEDGDGNPFPFSAAQDAILMTGTSRLEFNDNGEYIVGDGTDLTIVSGAKINLTSTTDVHVANGTGIVVGHTAQVAMGEVTAETQILGTTETDATLAIGLFSTTDALSPSLKFVKGAHANIGTHSTTVADNEELGKIQAYGSDATDSDTLSSEIAFNIDDDGVGAGTLGGEILLKTSGKDGTLDTSVTLDSSQNATFAGSVTIPEKLIHAGDADTYIQFQNDRITHVAGGQEFLDYSPVGDDYLVIGSTANVNVTLRSGSGVIAMDGGDSTITVTGDTTFSGTTASTYIKPVTSGSPGKKIRGLAQDFADLSTTPVAVSNLSFSDDADSGVMFCTITNVDGDKMNFLIFGAVEAGVAFHYTAVAGGGGTISEGASGVFTCTFTGGHSPTYELNCATASGLATFEASTEVSGATSLNIMKFG